jgi:8-oxo-dGTP pyrophosphatase MutT (NUDIX family)
MIADHFIVNVEGAIVQDGQYLLIVRAEEEFAPGGLSLPGGKVEKTGDLESVLEATLRREIAEEVGLEVRAEMAYVRSSAFIADGGPVVDVVFLCRHKAGRAVVADPSEVAGVRWMTASDAIKHPETAPWTRQSLVQAEQTRIRKGW